MTFYDCSIAALTVWREAGNQPEAGRRAVLHVILNRAKDNNRWPNTVAEVCTQPKQFSCFNAGDINATRWPKAYDKAFQECLALAVNPGDDPTDGANHYHASSVKPIWADPKKITHRIGDHIFYKL